MARTGGGARYLKYGCLGCAGLVGVVALVIVVIAGVAWLGAADPVFEDRVLTHDVPQPEAAAGDQAIRDLPPRPGTVRLDIANADCEIRPAGAGEALQVDARFDTNRYALEEAFAEGDGGAWSYSLAFRRTGGGFFASLREMFSAGRPQLEILLPPDVPYALEVDAGQGGCIVQLGGLWLTDATLRGNMAGLMLRIDEPTREPLESMTIDIRMAGVQLDRLGNASPKRLDVDVRMAGMTLDLGGAWRSDSDVTVKMQQGGGTLRLPDDVDVEGLEAKGIQSGAEPELPRPTLRFSPRSVLDDVDVRR